MSDRVFVPKGFVFKKQSITNTENHKFFKEDKGKERDKEVPDPGKPEESKDSTNQTVNVMSIIG